MGACDGAPVGEKGPVGVSENGGRDGAARIPVRLSMDDPEPMYRQIEDQLRDLIVSGQLPPGTHLPSVRGLAKDLACSVITTRRAYQDLENGGLIKTRQGMGTVVANLGPETKDFYRQQAILAAFSEAVGAGRRVGFSEQELREIFEEALNDGENQDG